MFLFERELDGNQFAANNKGLFRRESGLGGGGRGELKNGKATNAAEMRAAAVFVNGNGDANNVAINGKDVAQLSFSDITRDVVKKKSIRDLADGDGNMGDNGIG